MVTRIFLTGASGCGKSTVVAKVLEELKEKGLKVAGILTPEIRHNSREGFEIIDIASGMRGILAAEGLSSPHRVSKYGVSVPDIDRIVEQLERSLAAADIIIIDELGKMELCSERFRVAIDRILKSDKPLIATLHRTLVRQFEQYGEIVVVTATNRNSLPGRILKQVATS